MRRSPEELLARVSTTRHPIENLLVQFSLLSLVILTILAVVLSIILTTRLNREFELLRGYAAAADAGVSRTSEGLLPELDTDLNNLILTTYVTVGGGFFILYAGLISIVWRAWRTIKSQEGDLIETNADLREAYQDLQEAQERLVRTERLAAIGQLSAGVAHDLRNPLGAIKNSVYYLKGKLRDSELAEDNPRIVEFLDIMEEEVDSSNQILSGLMDYARVNEPQTTPTQLESVVDSALARFNIKSNVKVIKSFDPALPQVMVGLSVLNCELFAGRSLYSESVRRSQRVLITWERVRRTARRPGTRPNHRRRGGRRRLECLAIRAARSIRSADDAQGSAGPHSLGQRTGVYGQGCA